MAHLEKYWPAWKARHWVSLITKMGDHSIVLTLPETEGNVIKKVGFLATAAFVLLLTSCEYHVENEDLQGTLCDPMVSFSADIAPLIANNCMPCHNGDGENPRAPNLTTYASVKSISGLVREVTQSRRMPLNGTITDAQIEAIRCWVDNGAMNN